MKEPKRVGWEMWEEISIMPTSPPDICPECQKPDQHRPLFFYAGGILCEHTLPARKAQIEKYRMTPQARHYVDLNRQLIDILTSNAGIETPRIEKLREEMDAIWAQLTDAELHEVDMYYANVEGT